MPRMTAPQWSSELPKTYLHYLTFCNSPSPSIAPSLTPHPEPSAIGLVILVPSKLFLGQFLNWNKWTRLVDLWKKLPLIQRNTQEVFFLREMKIKIWLVCIIINNTLNSFRWSLIILTIQKVATASCTRHHSHCPGNSSERSEYTHWFKGILFIYKHTFNFNYWQISTWLFSLWKTISNHISFN